MHIQIKVEVLDNQGDIQDFNVEAESFDIAQEQLQKIESYIEKTKAEAEQIIKDNE